MDTTQRMREAEEKTQYFRGLEEQRMREAEAKALDSQRRFELADRL